MNDDQRAGLPDVLAYGPVFNTVAPGPPYSARFDLNVDGVAGLADILSYISVFNSSCAP